MTHTKLHHLSAAELGLQPGSPGYTSHILSLQPRNIDSTSRKQNVPISVAIITFPNWISSQLSDVNLSSDLAIHQVKLLLWSWWQKGNVWPVIVSQQIFFWMNDSINIIDLALILLLIFTYYISTSIIFAQQWNNSLSFEQKEKKYICRGVVLCLRTT